MDCESWFDLIGWDITGGVYGDGRFIFEIIPTDYSVRNTEITPEIQEYITRKKKEPVLITKRGVPIVKIDPITISEKGHSDIWNSRKLYKKIW